jgi:hypothetical protein
VGIGKSPVVERGARMIVNQDPQRLDHEPDEVSPVQSRRTLLRRSLLGITGVGLAALLAACGDEDDDEDNGENEVETIESEGEDVVDEVEEEVDEEIDDEGN